MASEIAMALGLIEEAQQSLRNAIHYHEEGSAGCTIYAEQAIHRLADALGRLAKLSPNAMGAGEPTGLGFMINASYHTAQGPGGKKNLGYEVMQHAQKHYNEGGWDVLIETVSREAIDLAVCDCTSLEEALKRVDTVFGLSVYNEKREDIRAAGDCE